MYVLNDKGTKVVNTNCLTYIDLVPHYSYSTEENETPSYYHIVGNDCTQYQNRIILGIYYDYNVATHYFNKILKGLKCNTSFVSLQPYYMKTKELSEYVLADTDLTEINAITQVGSNLFDFVGFVGDKPVIYRFNNEGIQLPRD